MKKTFLAGMAMLSASAAFAQNSVTISQSGDPSGNRAVVSQSGSGNSIVINQSSSTIDETRKTETRKSRSNEGNQVSLRVDPNTQTTINQHNSGPNSVELWQDGNSSTTINQSSGTNENTVVTHPHQSQPTRKARATKRRKRP
ncbi:curlin repeat-containing protein [Spirosoma soli]|uniref:Curlin repeat-containing protein n=1 Tax=Spirosoma soli TaxID=1770529 RepID=A0ABW5MBT7_9BACT